LVLGCAFTVFSKLLRRVTARPSLSSMWFSSGTALQPRCFGRFKRSGRQPVGRASCAGGHGSFTDRVETIECEGSSSVGRIVFSIVDLVQEARTLLFIA
jgi:hypothetical protein